MILTPEIWPKDRWPCFSHGEMACTHCGVCDMDPYFMDRLQKLRTEYGHSMIVTSGYRCPEHPIESAKGQPGAHATGCAVDIHVSGGQQAYGIITGIGSDEFTGIGISLGSARFVHLDTIENNETHLSRPNLWIY